MKKYFPKKYLIEILVTTVFLVAIELIFRAVEGFAIFDWATFRIFLSSFFLVVFFTFFISLAKKEKTRKFWNIRFPAAWVSFLSLYLNQ